MSTTEWGTLLPNGNVCQWDNEQQARAAALRSKSFPGGEHLLVSRECGPWVAPVSAVTVR